MSGRVNRITYFTGVVIFIILAFSQIFIFVQIYPTLLLLDRSQTLLDAIILFYNFLIVIFFELLEIRRLHDVGVDWYMSSFVFDDGEKKKNKWGKPPKPGIDFKGLFGF